MQKGKKFILETKRLITQFLLFFAFLFWAYPIFLTMSLFITHIVECALWMTIFTNDIHHPTFHCRNCYVTLSLVTHPNYLHLYHQHIRSGVARYQAYCSFLYLFSPNHTLYRSWVSKSSCNVDATMMWLGVIELLLCKFHRLTYIYQ
jgi:hypothetical protein